MVKSKWGTEWAPVGTENVLFHEVFSRTHRQTTGCHIVLESRIPSLQTCQLSLVYTFIFHAENINFMSLYLRRKLKYSSCLACAVCIMIVWKVWRSRAQMWDWDTAGWEWKHWQLIKLITMTSCGGKLRVPLNKLGNLCIHCIKELQYQVVYLFMIFIISVAYH